MHKYIAAILFFSSVNVYGAKTGLSQVFPEGETLVFSRLQASYQKQDLEDVVKQHKALKSNYPNSLYTDQATYMMGLLELKKGRYAEALKAFSVIERKTPLSNKRPEAMFAIAMTYKKLELPQQASFMLSKIEKSYPGSPESRRAALERRLIKVK